MWVQSRMINGISGRIFLSFSFFENDVLCKSLNILGNLFSSLFFSLIFPFWALNLMSLKCVTVCHIFFINTFANFKHARNIWLQKEKLHREKDNGTKISTNVEGKVSFLPVSFPWKRRYGFITNFGAQGVRRSKKTYKVFFKDFRIASSFSEQGKRARRNVIKEILCGISRERGKNLNISEHPPTQKKLFLIFS